VGQNIEFLIVKAGGTQSNYLALSVTLKLHFRGLTSGYRLYQHGLPSVGRLLEFLPHIYNVSTW
jgi:hypothetical protein